MHEKLRINHLFLSYFVSAGTIDMDDLEYIMKVNDSETTFFKGLDMWKIWIRIKSGQYHDIR